MSKIHEALKRAQQERTLGIIAEENIQGADPSAIPVVANDPVPRPSHSEPILPPRTEHAAPAAPSSVPPRAVSGRPTPQRDLAQNLLYEDFLKRCAKPGWSPDQNALVLQPSREPLLGAEQFRTLRSRLYHLRETARLKKLLITSAIPGEGKTYVTSNIAQAIALEKDRRVLIIDGDLRKPRLHLPFNAPLMPGLADYLLKDLDEASVVQHSPENNLCLIPAGDETAHASELLSAGKMQKLLDRLEPFFDWIIIDSPPFLPVADAGILAGLCDGVLLVVRASYTPSAMAQKARKELQKRNVIGVVLNAVEKSGVYESYHSYGYGRKPEYEG